VGNFERFVHSVLGRDLLIGLGLFSIVAFVATAFVVPVVLTRLPADYLLRAAPSERRHPLLFLLKNVLGVLVILLGVLMLVLPGQGILTIVLGLGLVDFPGRRRFEQRVLSTPSVLKTVNALRRRSGHAPLEIPPHGRN
jgi:hypothetical protein